MDTATSILAIDVAVPENYLDQLSLGPKMADAMRLDSQQSQWLNKIHHNSGIRKRHVVLQDFQDGQTKWTYWDENAQYKSPGTEARNAIYKKEAPKLAYSAAKKVLDQWGGSFDSITHLIFISCTGMMAPGVQHYLTHSLPLKASVNQIAINFMGCFGAFKGIDLASAFAQQNSTNRILVVCTELCSLHYQLSTSPELQIANAIFADGAAAIVVGCDPKPKEKSLWNVIKSTSLSIAKTEGRMTWEATDQGFCMGLKPDVPKLIKKHIPLFVKNLVPDKVSFEDCEWPIHPGGKSILKSIEEACKLNPNQTQASWKVLEDYGNMSSGTFLFVLKELLKKPKQKKWAVGLGFGPGLTMEGVLLRRPGKSDA